MENIIGRYNTCFVCGDKFTAQKKYQKTCSDICLKKYMEKKDYKRICSICKKPYISTRKSKYCSVECANISGNRRKGDKKPDGEFWFNIVEFVNERDMYTCQDCGENKKTLYVHHIIPLYKNGTNESENLISLCAKCHGKAHKIEQKGV